MHKTIMPTLWFLGALVLQILLHLIMPIHNIIGGALRLLGLIPLIAGTLTNIWADKQFKDKKTPVRTDLNPSAIILSGPFTLTRNPMYLGMAWALLGVSLLLGSIVSLLVIPVFVLIMDRFYIPFEEKKMENRFGEQYRLYSKRVRRWM